MSNYPGALSGGWITHRFQSLKADLPDPSVVNPVNWNQSHIIGSGAIQSGALGASVVNSGGLASGSVTYGTLASGAVSSGAHGPNSVVSGNIAALSVTSGAIASGATSWNLFGSSKPFVTVTPNGPTDGGDYGPNTVGTTTAGIQEALNSLPSTGGTAYLAAGTYTITSTINVTKSDTTVVGAGTESIVKLGNSANVDVFTVGDGTNTYQRVLLRDFQINGNKANNAAGHGITFNKFILRSSCVRLYILNATKDGIHYNGTGSSDGCHYCTISMCIIDSSGNDNIQDNYGEHLVVIGCPWINAAGRYGINITAASERLENCFVNASTSHNINLNSSNGQLVEVNMAGAGGINLEITALGGNTNIDACVFENATSTDLDINAPDCTVINSFFPYSNQLLVSISNNRNIFIGNYFGTGSRSVANGYSNISVGTNVQGCVIVGNNFIQTRVSGNQPKSAIDFSVGTTGNIIKDNFVTGTWNPIFSGVAFGNIFRDNRSFNGSTYNGFNPAGVISTPYGGTITNPFGASTIGAGGTGASPTTGTTYTANEPVDVTIAAGTGQTITTKDAGGNIIDSAVATLSHRLLKTNYTIVVNFTVLGTTTVIQATVGLGGTTATAQAGANYVVSGVEIYLIGGSGLSISTFDGITNTGGNNIDLGVTAIPAHAFDIGQVIVYNSLTVSPGVIGK